jgi:hypothetical protein
MSEQDKLELNGRIKGMLELITECLIKGMKFVPFDYLDELEKLIRQRRELLSK